MELIIIYVVQKKDRHLKPFGFIKGVCDKCVSKYEYFGGITLVLLFTEFDSFNFHVSWFLTGSKVFLTVLLG